MSYQLIIMLNSIQRRRLLWSIQTRTMIICLMQCNNPWIKHGICNSNNDNDLFQTSFHSFNIKLII